MNTFMNELFETLDQTAQRSLKDFDRSREKSHAAVEIAALDKDIEYLDTVKKVFEGGITIL